MKKAVVSILLFIFVGFFSCACTNNDSSYKRVELLVYADIQSAIEQIYFVETKEYVERLVLSEDHNLEMDINNFLSKLWKDNNVSVTNVNDSIIIKIDSSNNLVYSNLIDLPIF